MRNPRSFASENHHVVDAAYLRRRLFGTPDVPGWASLRGPDGAGLAYQINVHRWEVNLSLGCPTPRLRGYIGRGSVYRKAAGRPLLVEHLVPCRRKSCDHCMKMRSNLWSARAVGEYHRSQRTWFVTFTLSPQEHAILDVQAYKLWTKEVPPSSAELLKLRTLVFSRRIRAWLKRVREAAYRRGQPVAGNVKYLAVAEVHDSEKTSDWMRGRPHFHMLLHEREYEAVILNSEIEIVPGKSNEGRPEFRVIDSALLRQQWPWGFTKVSLAVDEKSVFYLCKYLHKAPMHRIYASIGYYKEDRSGGAGLLRPERSEEAVPGEGERGVSPSREIETVHPERSVDYVEDDE